MGMHEDDEHSKSIHYYVDVEYNTATRQVDSKIQTDYANYSACRVGMIMSVTYLPDAPEQVRSGQVTAADVANDQRGLLTVTVVVLIIGALEIIVCESKLRAEYRLVRNGVFVMATVSEVREVHGRGGKVYYIDYNFDVAGQPFAGTVARRLAPDDDQLVVVYDPVRPQHNMPIDDISQVGPGREVGLYS